MSVTSNLAWVLLAVAGLLEIVWSVSMKASQGFSKLHFTAITLIAAGLSFWLLGLALRQLPVGTAYAVWTGIGALGAAVLGIALLTSGNFSDSRRCFEKALSITRKDDLAWAGMGLLDFYENKIEFSLANLEQAVYREPTEPDYLFALGQISARAERYQESAEAYRRFLTVSNDMDTDRRERIKGLISFLTFLGTKTSLYDTGGAEQTSEAGADQQHRGERPAGCA